MNEHESLIRRLLNQAQSGEKTALGQLLEEHRPWLRVVAKRYLSSLNNARFDESDVIQQTCLSVHRNFSKFRGDQIGEFLAWLRKVHEQNLQNAIRNHFVAQKRAIGREQPIDPTRNLASELQQRNTISPSQRLMQGERSVALAAALEKLPENQREAVRLRHLEGWPLAQIATEMDRSEQAVVGYLKRGLEKLRRLLQ